MVIIIPATTIIIAISMAIARAIIIIIIKLSNSIDNDRLFVYFQSNFCFLSFNHHHHHGRTGFGTANNGRRHYLIFAFLSKPCNGRTWLHRGGLWTGGHHRHHHQPCTFCVCERICGVRPATPPRWICLFLLCLKSSKKVEKVPISPKKRQPTKRGFRMELQNPMKSMRNDAQCSETISAEKRVLTS